MTLLRGWRASLLAELDDLRHSTLAWLGLGAVVATALLLGMRMEDDANGYLVYEAALQPATRIAALFLLGIAAVTVASDRTRGTVRWILPRPIARAGWIAGKAAALALVALVYLGGGAGAAWAAASGHGFGDITADIPEADDGGFTFIEEEVVPPEFQAAQMKKRAWIATLLALPALLTAANLGLLVSCLVSSAAAAVMAALAVALPLYYLPELFGLSESAARTLPLRAASDFFEQLAQFGERMATSEWPSYGSAPLLGAVIGAFGLPALAAALFTRLDVSD